MTLQYANSTFYYTNSEACPAPPLCGNTRTYIWMFSFTLHTAQLILSRVLNMWQPDWEVVVKTGGAGMKKEQQLPWLFFQNFHNLFIFNNSPMADCLFFSFLHSKWEVTFRSVPLVDVDWTAALEIQDLISGLWGLDFRILQQFMEVQRSVIAKRKLQDTQLHEWHIESQRRHTHIRTPYICV